VSIVPGLGMGNKTRLAKGDDLYESWRKLGLMEDMLHQLMVNIPLFIGFQQSFWWCRMMQPSTVAMVL